MRCVGLRVSALPHPGRCGRVCRAGALLPAVPTSPRARARACVRARCCQRAGLRGGPRRSTPPLSAAHAPPPRMLRHGLTRLSRRRASLQRQPLWRPQSVCAGGRSGRRAGRQPLLRGRRAAGERAERWMARRVAALPVRLPQAAPSRGPGRTPRHACRPADRLWSAPCPRAPLAVFAAPGAWRAGRRGAQVLRARAGGWEGPGVCACAHAPRAGGALEPAFRNHLPLQLRAQAGPEAPRWRQGRAVAACACVAGVARGGRGLVPAWRGRRGPGRAARRARKGANAGGAPPREGARRVRVRAGERAKGRGALPQARKSTVQRAQAMAKTVVSSPVCGERPPKGACGEARRRCLLPRVIH